MADRTTGTVKWFNAAKGYGFISHEGGKDLFVHFSEIQEAGTGYRELKEGDQVESTVGTSPKGPQATNVVKIESSRTHCEFTAQELHRREELFSMGNSSMTA